MSDAPLSTLLAMRRRRQPESLRGWWLMLGLCSLALVWLPYQLPIQVATVFLVAAYPLAVACRNASILGSLRQGGCLDELLTTRTTAMEWLDDLARATGREVLSSWPWLSAFWLFWAAALWHLGLWSCLAPVGILVQAALAVVASYMAAAGQAWSSGEDDVVARTLLMGAVLLPPSALAACLTAKLGPVGLAPLLGIFVPWRVLGAYGLHVAPHLRDHAGRVWKRLMSRQGNPWTFLPFSSNAILYREARMEAHRIPGRVVGVLLWRHGPALALTFLLAVASSRPLVWLALVVFLLVQTLTAAYRTVGSLVVERESNTLETLLATPLSTTEWVDGWAAVGYSPRLVEMVLAGPAMILACWAVNLGWFAGLAAVGVITLLSVGAAYAGVLASARGGSRGGAHDLVGLEICARLWGAGVLGLVLAVALPTVLVWVPVVLAAALVRWIRTSCLRRLSLSQPVPLDLLRSCLRWAAPLGFVRRMLDRLEREGLVAAAEPGLGPALSLALGQKAPEGFKERLWERFSSDLL